MGSNLTARTALRTAREKCRTAKRRGAIYGEEFILANGRTLIVGHAPAAGGGQLFGAWVYWYQEQDSRERKLGI